MHRLVATTRMRKRNRAGMGNSSRGQYSNAIMALAWLCFNTGLDWTPTRGQYWTHGLKFEQSMRTFAVIQDEKETNKLVVAYSEVLVGKTLTGMEL